MAAGVAEKLHFCIKAIKKRVGESKCFVGFKINSKPRHGDSCFGPLKPCGLRCQSDAQLASGQSRSITGTKNKVPFSADVVPETAVAPYQHHTARQTSTGFPLSATVTNILPASAGTSISHCTKKHTHSLYRLFN